MYVYINIYTEELKVKMEIMTLILLRLVLCIHRARETHKFQCIIYTYKYYELKNFSGNCESHEAPVYTGGVEISLSPKARGKGQGSEISRFSLANFGIGEVQVSEVYRLA